MVDRIMDSVDASEWGPAAERQLCYEIKARGRTRARTHLCHEGQGSVPCAEARVETSVLRQTFVLAGHETSAAMLTWSLYELSRNTVRGTALPQTWPEQEAQG